MGKGFRYFLVFAIVLCLSGCGVKKNSNGDEDKKEIKGKNEVQSEEGNETEASPETIIYEDRDVVVREVEILKEPQLAEISWLDIDKETLIKESDLIFEGTIKEIKEIEIEPQHLDVTYMLYKTLLTLSVDKVISEKEGSGRKDGDITLLVAASSREYDKRFTPMVKGKKYEFIVKSSATAKDDVNKISKYSDYYIDLPIDEIRVIEELPLPTMKPIASEGDGKKENVYDIKQVIKNVEEILILYTNHLLRLLMKNIMEYLKLWPT